jgi:3-methyladenine DNA glycosylase AlkD
MTFDEIIQELKDGGDPRAIAVWKRTKLDFKNYYGNNLTKLKALSKRVKKNHDMALKLWATEVHDARLLATMIADPKLADENLVDNWMGDARTWDLSDKLCQNVIAKMPLWDEKIKTWTKSPKEMLQRSGFILLYIKAKKGKDWIDADFDDYLKQIENEINQAPNWSMEAMNTALIAIGGRSKQMNRKAMAVAKKIGTITIDYGDTSCKNPDAVDSLTAQRSRGKFD